eukprot:8766579-Pyramimonas_sp.AAC.1
MHLNSVYFDSYSLVGDAWKNARIMQFILGDEPLMAADVGLEPEGEIGHRVARSREDAASTAEGGSPSALS